MTKDEIALIVGWLAEPESFDFMIDAHRVLLVKARRSLSVIADDKKRLFWARSVDEPTECPQIVEISAYLYDGKLKLQVKRIGDNSVYNYDNFRDYTPIAAPKPVNSPS